MTNNYKNNNYPNNATNNQRDDVAFGRVFPSQIIGTICCDKLVYTHSNEEIAPIISALDISEEDSVLSVCGSGDVPFAMLSQAGSVCAVDVNCFQVHYAENRLEALKRADVMNFLRLDPCSGENNGCSIKRLFDKNMQYLLGADFDVKVEELVAIGGSLYPFKHYSRLESIFAKYHNLEFHNDDIFSFASIKHDSFNKLYFSNADPFLDFSTVYEMLDVLDSGVLIYFAGNLGRILTDLRARHPTRDNSSIDRLFLDTARTKIARKKQDRFWNPEVYVVS